MGSSDAWSRSAALDNIDKHLRNPTIKEGRITKAVVASSRCNLGTNVHTLFRADNDESVLHNTYLDYDHSKELPSQLLHKNCSIYLDTDNRVGSNASGPPNASHQAASYASRAAPSPAKEKQWKPYVVGYNGPPKSPFQALMEGVKKSSSQLPHLRAPSSITSSEASKASDAVPAAHLSSPSVASSQHTVKSTQKGPASPKTQSFSPSLENQALASRDAVKLSKPMNAGLKNKSAAMDSTFPCSYLDCTKGFSRAKDLKRHKATEHDWCSVCDIDCEDDVALIEHRISSTLAEEGKHIACLKCGDDFGCEAGRNRHTQLVHREVQEIRCPGCGVIFERAAGLVAHIQSDRCKDRSGLVSSAVLSKGRVDAALEMERLVAMAGKVELATEDGSVDRSTTHAAPSLLDGDEETNARDMHGNNENGLANVMSDGGSANDASDAGSNKTAANEKWAKTLFPDARSTPVTEDWTPPKAQPHVLRGGRGASNHTASVSIISGKRQPTDWDYFVFERDPMDKLKCPFQRCDFTYVDEAAVKAHLISGYHQGTAQQCVKCLKMFDNAVKLLAHMESPSTRCNVRDTQQYGHILYMVSGGFIDVNDDERGTRLADGQLRMRARTRAELAEQQTRREEEQKQRERQIAAQW